MTHVGAVRTVNEDSYFTSDRLCLVADGMGGHEAGEVASGLATELLGEAVAAREELALLDLEPLISSVNRSIRAYGADHEATGMGTTVVGVAVIANGGTYSAVVFNVGDSRCYRLVEGRIEQLTTDHSHVQELVDAGEISMTEARSHPLRNVVTRALGVDAEVRADYFVLDDVSCRLLLCSDGLSGDVGLDVIEATLVDHTAPSVAAQRLIDAALDGAARDNITAVVVDLEFAMAHPDDDTVPNQQVRSIAAEITAPRSRAAADVVRRAFVDLDGSEPDRAGKAVST